MGVIIITLWVVITILIYLSARRYINKHYDANLPLVPDRYYDNPGLTFAMATLTLGSIAIGYCITRFILQFFGM